jgi:hypothetical protein
MVGSEHSASERLDETVVCVGWDGSVKGVGMILERSKYRILEGIVHGRKKCVVCLIERKEGMSTQFHHTQTPILPFRFFRRT